MRQLLILGLLPALMLVNGMIYEWIERKLVARLQNRVGPRWFQPAADAFKLLVNEEIMPQGVHPVLFVGLPVVALAGVLTAALYSPMFGLTPAFSFAGDLIVTIYLLSLLSLCLGLAGANTHNPFALLGTTRTFTQLFAYEAPFLLALLGPAAMAGSWQINEINHYMADHWIIGLQPLGFVVALLGLMGKLEIPPFNAPEAETEIVAGTLTEYSGRGLALFRLAKDVEKVIGFTLVAALYLGGLATPLEYLLKTLALLVIVAVLQTLWTRLRIDQSANLWWRYGVIVILAQWLLILIMEVWK